MIYGRLGDSAAIRTIDINVDTTKRGTDLLIGDDGGCPGPACPEGLAFSGIGFALRAFERAKLVVKSGEANRFPDALALIKNGLADEAVGAPEDVSAPYSILVINSGGARWQDGYQGACPAINK